MEMTKNLMNPVQTPRSNAVLKAPSGMDNCSDLHITRIIYEDGSQAVISVWKSSSFLERLKFLFKGKISFLCYGMTHPPVSFFTGDITESMQTQSEAGL